MKILLADDDSKIHMILRMWLTRDGHDLDHASNGCEAIERLDQGSFDVLISDVNMPLMTGVDLAKAALDRPDCPELIVLLTSRCDTHELAKEIGSPRVHLMNKPFSPAELAKLINELSPRQVYK